MADESQPDPSQLDVVQHPTLGTLKFPKSMGFDERNQIIQGMEAGAAKVPPPPSATSGFMEQHPVAREAALGAFSGLGIPETMTPVRDLARGVAQLGAPPTTTGEKVSTALGVPVPAYRMAKGLAEQTYGLGQDGYQGLSSREMAQAEHGGAAHARD